MERLGRGKLSGECPETTQSQRVFWVATVGRSTTENAAPILVYVVFPFFLAIIVCAVVIAAALLVFTNSVMLFC
jgi:hypothetical protein